MIECDEIDAHLVELLKKDSRASFRKIAKEIGLSADTVMRRYHKLVENNIIQATIRIDLGKLGYSGQVYFAIKVSSKGSLRQVTDKVAQIPDITAVMETGGEYDLVAICWVRSIDGIFEKGDCISNILGVIGVFIEQILGTKTEFKGYENFMIFPPEPWHNLHTNPF